MPERFSLYPDLTVEENMNFFADIYLVARKRRESLKYRLLEKTGMVPFTNRQAGALSGGMKQKLALSTILLSSPRIILLDEPTTGVDPLSRIEFFKILGELKAEGKTILMSTPYLDEAEAGDQVIFLKNGTLLAQAPIRRLKRDFPLQLYRLLPEGNLFEALENIRRQGAGENLVYIRGKYLRLLKREGEELPRSVPFREAVPQPVTLEDIYLYYEQNTDA
jgi:ABC-2 type transport system ATP-binding protein